MSESVQGGGLFSSIRRLLATAFEMAQVRLELLGTEVDLEKRRIFDGLLWGAIALMVVGVGLVLLCELIIYLVWEGYRLATLGVLTLLFLVSGGLLIREARQRLSSSLGLFSASVSELRRDSAELRTSSKHDA